MSSLITDRWLTQKLATFMGSTQGLTIRILRILKVLKIYEFLRILKLSVLKYIKLKLSHSSSPNSNIFFIANTTLNFWIKKFCDVNNKIRQLFNSPA